MGQISRINQGLHLRHMLNADGYRTYPSFIRMHKKLDNLFVNKIEKLHNVTNNIILKCGFLRVCTYVCKCVFLCDVRYAREVVDVN